NQATKHFALIADAYEVLSDPHERAWYDSHRDAILQGGDPSDQTEGAAGTTSAVLMKYFSSTAFKGFEDGNAGFFSIFRNLFNKLAEEESEAEDSTGDQTHYPTFGMSTTPYDNNSDSDVKQFYNSWLTFSTQKTFAWCDKYRLSEAPDRRVRRAMEKENKKLRDVARKEFNETVTEQQKEKQKQVQADMKARLEKEKEILRAKAEQFQEQAWTRVQEEDPDNEDGSGPENAEEDGFDQEFRNSNVSSATSFSNRNDSGRTMSGVRGTSKPWKRFEWRCCKTRANLWVNTPMTMNPWHPEAQPISKMI
ncbi:hypothetical protein B0O80DRAFT_455674, partial [Mortierella sp. GBAus27b]